MIDWNIQSRSHRCQACEHPFADKMPYYTLLFQQRHHLERQDVCEKCWNTQFSQGATDRKGFISFWQGIFNVPPPPPPEPIPKENAEGLLRRLCEEADPEMAAVRYILAAMLERKRMLKIKAQSQQDGQRVFVYEHTRTSDVITIVDPNLRLDQLEDVQHRVAQLLAHGLDPLPATAPATPSLTPIDAKAAHTSKPDAELNEPAPSASDQDSSETAPEASRIDEPVRPGESETRGV
jgi:hypothetical protein